MISNATLQAGQIEIALDLAVLAQELSVPATDLTPDLSHLTADFTARRRGVETKIVAGDRRPTPDPTLIRALRLAHLWADRLKTGTPMQQIAQEAKVTVRYIARLVPLTGLSPRLQSAIFAGTQPVDLTLESLIRRPLPLDWSDQDRHFAISR